MLLVTGLWENHRDLDKLLTVIRQRSRAKLYLRPSRFKLSLWGGNSIELYWTRRGTWLRDVYCSFIVAISSNNVHIYLSFARCLSRPSLQCLNWIKVQTDFINYRVKRNDIGKNLENKTTHSQQLMNAGGAQNPSAVLTVSCCLVSPHCVVPCDYAVLSWPGLPAGVWHLLVTRHVTPGPCHEHCHTESQVTRVTGWAPLSGHNEKHIWISLLRSHEQIEHSATENRIVASDRSGQLNLLEK